MGHSLQLSGSFKTWRLWQSCSDPGFLASQHLCSLPPGCLSQFNSVPVPYLHTWSNLPGTDAWSWLYLVVPSPPNKVLMIPWLFWNVKNASGLVRPWLPRFSSAHTVSSWSGWICFTFWRFLFLPFAIGSVLTEAFLKAFFPVSPLAPNPSGNFSVLLL